MAVTPSGIPALLVFRTCALEWHITDMTAQLIVEPDECSSLALKHWKICDKAGSFMYSDFCTSLTKKWTQQDMQKMPLTVEDTSSVIHNLNITAQLNI